MIDHESIADRSQIDPLARMINASSSNMLCTPCTCAADPLTFVTSGGYRALQRCNLRTARQPLRSVSVEAPPVGASSRSSDPMIQWKHSRTITGRKRPYYRSGSWSRVRRSYLRINSTCEACGRRYHLIAHHIIPSAVDPSLLLIPSNLITLCDPGTHDRGCHLSIGHLGNFNTYNPHVREDAANQLARLSGAR